MNNVVSTHQPTPTHAPTYPTVVEACCRWKVRQDSLKLKGRTADKAALEFILGCSVGAGLAGDPKLEQHFCLIATLVAVRGAFELRRIALDMGEPQS